MIKIIGNFKVELGNEVLMIKKASTGELIKAEAVKAFESEDKFKELCETLQAKIDERKDKGLSV
tara:strand:+ start:1832 stop:2023 length:192 start_codon:yes stop_codon:yes gene_type:complete